jgi:membrane protein implicated in regulation of membrane protease activity
MPAAVKYALLQIPGAVLFLLVLVLLQSWLHYSGWIVWGLLALWLVKDAALFPFVRNAFLPHLEEESNPLVGCRGIARESLDPGGYILIRGELWRAKVPAGAAPVQKGESVRVRRVQGLTLLVEPDPGQKEDSPPTSS